MEPDQAAGGEVLSLARPRRNRALPSGDVTFVFTDVEGSTRLLTELGERFAPLMAVQQSIVGQAMVEAGAVLVNAVGDEMFFACSEAETAVRGLLAAQAAMATYPWPKGHTFRVRAGVHTGPARPIGHSYTSLAVHQAARICAAGHGGQVLASAATAGLVAREGRELGRFRLKDFEAPVALVQYDAGEHPSLKVVPDAVRRLVLPDTSFVGREADLAEVNRLIDAHRLVTMCGPGGTGKTRLAIELASRFPAHVRVAVAELAGARNHSEVVSAVAAALDLAQSTDVAIIDLVTRYVAELTDAIVVLDNCEQVLDPVADVVDVLLRSAPDLRLLLTSREPLGSPEERVHRLEPFDPPAAGTVIEELLESDAARLLVDRVLARDADFQLGPVDVDHVVAICQRLDGSPLALELVAAEVATAGLAAARASVEAGAGINGGRGRPARHRSIGAALDWSYQLLEPAERLVWSRLAVFVAPFRAVDAIALACDADIIERVVRSAVSALVNKSVLTRVSAPDGDRYRMHQTVREFGQAVLRETGQLDAIRDRHGRWAYDFLDENYYRVTPPSWFAAFEVCRDDLVAAWHHLQETDQPALAAAVGSNTAYWDYFSNRSAEGAALLEEIASWPDAPYLAGPLIHAAAVVGRSQQTAKARAYLQQALAHPMEPKVETSAKDTLIEICLEEGDFDVVEGHVRQLLAVPAPEEAPTSHAWASGVLGVCKLCRGELHEAMRHTVDSRDGYLDAGQDLNVCLMSANLASISLLLDDREGARTHASAALHMAEAAKIGAQTWVARMQLAATYEPVRGSSELRIALEGLVTSGMPMELGDFYQSMPVLRMLEQWRALAVATGAFTAVYAAVPNAFPMLDQLLEQAETRCRAIIPAAEYDALFARGSTDPSYAAILAALD